MVDKARDKAGDAFDDAKRRGTDAAERGRDTIDDAMSSGNRDFQGGDKGRAAGGGGQGDMMDKAKDKAKDIAGGITDR